MDLHRLQWKPLIDGATNKPKRRDASGPAFNAANKPGKGFGETIGAKARKLIKLVAEHGSLELYERHVIEQEANGQPQLMRTYPDHEAFMLDLQIMQARGWQVLTQTQASTHTTAGRVGTGMAVGAILTGGVGAAVGGALGAASKKKGSLAVIYERQATSNSQQHAGNEQMMGSYTSHR